MKTKYFMRGLGTGLIVATLVLCMIYAYKMSDSQIISRAKELGMVYEKDANAPVLSEDEAEDTEKDANKSEEKQDDSQEETGQSQTSQGENSGETQSQENSTPSEEEQTSAESQSTETHNTGQTVTDTPYVTVTIDGGMNSVEVSNMLKNLGVISDAASFDYYLVKNGYSKNLQPGAHELLKGANYEELAYILTHRQN